jgi:hypothetical protein
VEQGRGEGRGGCDGFFFSGLPLAATTTTCRRAATAAGVEAGRGALGSAGRMPPSCPATFYFKCPAVHHF